MIEGALLGTLNFFCKEHRKSFFLHQWEADRLLFCYDLVNAAKEIALLNNSVWVS